MEHKHGNLIASIECAPVNKSTVYVKTLKQKELNKLSSSKTPKLQQVGRFHTQRKTSDIFLIATDRDGTFEPAKTLPV